jgi:mRNA interferase RelE/StbE
MASNFEGFSIVWLKSAHKSFEKLPIQEQKKINNNVELLITPIENDIKKLKGYIDLYRLRVGDYRIIFSLNKAKKHIIIAGIGHRKDIYSSLMH